MATPVLPFPSTAGAADCDIASVAALIGDPGRAADCSRSSHTAGISRACLDWSERQYHLAGALGGALVTSLVESQWVERMPSNRALG